MKRDGCPMGHIMYGDVCVRLDALKSLPEYFPCMVTRRADTDDAQTGREWLSLGEMYNTVNPKIDGAYLVIFPLKGYEKVTPAILESKKDVNNWIMKLMEKKK